MPELEKIMAFVGEEFKAEYFTGINTKPKQHEHAALFNPEELSVIAKLCGQRAGHYGYSLNQPEKTLDTVKADSP